MNAPAAPNIQQEARIDYRPPGPVAKAFIKSDAFVCGIKGPIGCTDSETEFLTPDGWKRIADYAPGDLVAQWSNGVLEYIVPDTYIDEPCEEMWLFRNEHSISMMLTDEHRMPLYDYKGEFKVKLAADVAAQPSKHAVPVHFLCQNPSSLTDIEIRLRVMIAADGHYRRAGKQCTIAVRKERKKARIRELLTVAGIAWSERARADCEREVIFAFDRPAFDKPLHLSHDWYQASTDELRVLLDECLFWDGLHDHAEQRFHTTKPEEADVIQFAAHACGRTAHIRKTCIEGWADQYVVQWSVEGSAKGKVMLRVDGVDIERVPATNGRKYCFTVPSSFWIARREDRIFVTGNSGKSTAACMKLIRNCQKQQRDKNGWIRRRTAIIRNTYPELRTTTIKTWHQWVPSHMGTYRETTPPTHHISDPQNKLDWEILFIALDRPDHVRKLLSLELSDAWINEAKEVPKAILDGLTGRVGRFPATIRDDAGVVIYGCTDPQIMMDTNPPDTDHWWYRLAEEPTPADVEQMAELTEKLREIGALRADQPLYEFFDQPGGEDEGAENLNNLTPGYYLKAKANKDADWIKVYIHGEYGFVRDGKPVYPDYRDNVHCRAFEPNPRLPLYLGFDFGLTPAAAFAQQMPNGQWRFCSEVVTERAGVGLFAELVKGHIAREYPNFTIVRVTGDPSGDQGQAGDADARSVFQILAANGIECEPAGTNDPTIRREAMGKPLRTMIDGEPGMLVHPNCRVLRKGLAGGFAYRRIQVAGAERYRDVPDKNAYSHICEAAEYLFMGAGEGKAVIKRERKEPRQQYAIADYNIFGDE